MCLLNCSHTSENSLSESSVDRLPKSNDSGLASANLKPAFLKQFFILELLMSFQTSQKIKIECDFKLSSDGRVYRANL